MSFVNLIFEVAQDNVFTETGFSPLKSVEKQNYIEFFDYVEFKRETKRAANPGE